MRRWETLMLITAGALVPVGAALMLLRGLGMRFSGILLLIAAALLAAGVLLRLWARRSAAGRWCRRIFCLGCCLLAVLLGTLETCVILAANRNSDTISADAVIILGAGVNGTQPSLSLRTRLDAALDYLEENPDIPVIVTGGRGYGEEITEARCMYNYLTARGVEPERIILEEQAANTAENFSFSRSCLTAAGVDAETGRVAFVTNDFHICRAGLLAKRQGYGLAFGVPAELPWLHLQINYYAREAFALVKTLIFD